MSDNASPKSELLNARSDFAGTKILHVMASADPRAGGPVEGVFSCAEIWSRYGVLSHILTLDPIDSPWLRTTRAPVETAGAEDLFFRWLGRWPRLARYGYSPRLAGRLRKISSNYDAVVLNGLWNYSSVGSWRALRDSVTPYYVFPHGSLDPWFKRAYPAKTIFKRLYWNLFEHKVLRDAAGVMFTAEEERHVAETSFSPYAARPFVVGYGARDAPAETSAQAEAFLQAAPAVAGRRFAFFLGRLHEKKGLDLLIAAFAPLTSRFPDFDLVIAGPDQDGLQGQLQRQAEALGLRNRIHWPGMLQGDAKAGAFRAAEVFVLPSHQENFGVVVAEALAFGKPTLITNKVNIWREVEADGAGVVVNDDTEGVREGLARVLALPPPDRARMAAAARRAFELRFDFDRSALLILETILSKGLRNRA